MKKYFTKNCLLLLVCIGFFNLSNAQFRSYITAYKALADSLSTVYGIPPSIILSVAAMESGNGKSRNAKLLNNHFGIKGKNKLKTTMGIVSKYKAYPSVTASYMDFCQLLSRRKFYLVLKNNPNANDWIKAIAKSGYSTRPKHWENQTQRILKNYFSLEGF